MLHEDLSVLLDWLVEEAVGDGEMLSRASILAIEKEPFEVCSELGGLGVLELLEELSLVAVAALFLPASTWEVIIGAEI